MWRLALIASTISMVLVSMLLSSVVFDWLIHSYLVVIAFVKTIAVWVYGILLKFWSWVLVGLKSLRFYDIFWLMLLPRLKRFWLFDMPYRFVSKHVLPILLFDSKTRLLIRQRMERAGALVGASFARSVEWWTVTTGPIFGRHTRTALGVLFALLIAVIVYLVYGAYLLIGLVPIPRPIIHALQAVWSFLLTMMQGVIQIAKQAVFRLAMLLGLAQAWTRLQTVVVTEERQRAFRRHRMRVVRAMITRRRRLSGRLQGLSYWQRFTLQWYLLMDMFFGRIESVYERVVVPIAVRNLQQPIECRYCDVSTVTTEVPQLRELVSCSCRRRATSVPA